MNRWFLIIPILCSCTPSWDDVVETYAGQDDVTDIAIIKDEGQLDANQSECESLVDEYCILESENCVIDGFTERSFETPFDCSAQLRVTRCRWQGRPWGYNLERSIDCVEGLREAVTCEDSQGIAEGCGQDLYRPVDCDLALDLGDNDWVIEESGFFFDDYGTFAMGCRSFSGGDQVNLYSSAAQGNGGLDSVVVLFNERWEVTGYSDDERGTLFGGLFDLEIPEDGTYYLVVIGYDASHNGPVRVTLEIVDE